MLEQSRAERLEYIDYLRFFGILLMVIGHVGFGSMVYKWIYSFHMPLWFFISGYFCNLNQNIIVSIKKRAKTLLIPYCAFGWLYVITYGLFYGVWQINGMLYPTTVQIPLNGALWFLLALFIVDIICLLCLKYITNLLCMLFLIAFTALLGSIFPSNFPFSISSAIVGLGFYLIGYLVKNYHSKLLRMPLWKTSILLLIGSTVALLNGQINMRTGNYGMPIVWWIDASIMIIGFWNLFRIITPKIHFSSFLEIGEKTIIYVCTNQAVLYVLRLFLNPTSVYEKLAINCMEVIIIMWVCLGLARIFDKMPFRFFIGKWEDANN